MSTPRQLLVAGGVALAIALPALPALPSSLGAQDFWSSLGFAEDDVKSRLLGALTGGGFNPPTVPALRALPSAARNSLISSAAAYAKRWTQSADFKQRYAEQREGNKPAAPEAALTLAQRKAKDRAELQKALASMDSMVTQAKGQPEVQAGIRAAMQEFRDQVKAIDDPTNPMYTKETQAVFDEQYAAQRAAYASALKEWETKNPVSPTPLIRQSLRNFLALAASVDFAAKTQQRPAGGVMFVNPDYESKPSEWKALYRAGKETTAALQAAAQQWLTELK